MRLGFYAYLLLSGFLPINFILLAKSIEQKQYLAAWCMLILVNLGMFATVRVVSILRTREKADSFIIKSSTPIDESILVYVVTYIPLLLGVDFTKTSGVVSLVIFYIVMAVVFVRSKTLFVNPIFMVMGWRFFDAKIESEGEEISVLLIAKRPKLKDGVNYRLRRITNLQTFIAV
tara:strand:+ start:312 stop:836 length:525 start_codon:yes stop_codon:yes gene_type:complete